jgi:two-component system, NtrC family, response regulator HydG
MGAGVKGRILLVDDNEDFLDSTKDVLEEEDYQVLTATSGEEAIRQLEYHDFHVIVMDIKMPGMNGVDTLVLMKRLDPQVKVIMCTAYIVENLIRQALEQGAYAVLNKPFEMSLLIRTIENAREPVHCGNVLIADRDVRLCGDLQELLTGKGHKVVVAHNGRDALAKARKNAFDVLLLDVNLPALNCFELCRRIKSIRTELLATIITGYGEEFDPIAQNRIRNETGVTSLTKPFDFEQLLELLESICSAGNEGN